MWPGPQPTTAPYRDLTGVQQGKSTELPRKKQNCGVEPANHMFPVEVLSPPPPPLYDSPSLLIFTTEYDIIFQHVHWGYIINNQNKAARPFQILKSPCTMQEHVNHRVDILVKLSAHHDFEGQIGTEFFLPLNHSNSTYLKRLEYENIDEMSNTWSLWIGVQHTSMLDRLKWYFVVCGLRIGLPGIPRESWCWGDHSPHANKHWGIFQASKT